MNKQLSLEQAVEITRRAFLPYQTRVGINRDKGRLEIAVTDRHGDTVVDIDDIENSEACDPERLRGILAFARDRAEARGFSLQPWWVKP
ncbi:MAG: hypothetical protein R3200_08665 [Xanthomonadales bacterium]|nr:hypothetical protein [Xanthomonadales bacterium]